MTDILERQAAQFVTHAVARLCYKYHSLVYASPLSTRSPDTWPAWHAGYRARHRGAIWARLVATLPVDAVTGPLRLLWRLRQFRSTVYGAPGERLLVAPSECGSVTVQGQFVTPYVVTEPSDQVYVIGKRASGSLSRRWKVSLGRDVLGPLPALLRAGFRAAASTEGMAEGRVMLLAMWLSWVLSLRWVTYLLLERDLSETVEKLGIRKIGCVHEMHPYSRVVWRLASREGLVGYTVQHATYSPDKRWFFPAQEETRAGLAVPDVYFVFDSETREMLREYLPSTNFRLGRSCRYAAAAVDAAVDSGFAWLFVTALPEFDNRAVLDAVRRILRDRAQNRPVTVRLHPNARLSWRDSLWLGVATRTRRVALSRNRPLADDLRNARAVIGMGSTALVEALAYGRPVVQLTRRDCPGYLDLGDLSGYTTIEPHALSVSVLESAESLTTSPQEAARRLGSGNPAVSYGVLFSDSGLKGKHLVDRSHHQHAYVKPKTVVYYPVGTVHMRNLWMLAERLPEYRFRVFYRKKLPWFSKRRTGESQFESVFDRFDSPPTSLFSGDVCALVLSIAAIDRIVAELIEMASAAGVPVIAIEEVNQLVLNDGRINHYLMPVDHLLVASETERHLFEQLGIPTDRISVTGWPFYSGLEHNPDKASRERLRDALKIPKNKRVVTLCLSKLSALGDISSLETLAVRQDILHLLKEGLVEGFHVLVKLHPTEKSPWAVSLIRRILPEASIVAGETGIGEILGITDVCLNRGNSQTVLEALLRGIPTLVLPCGIRTVFDGVVDEAVIRTPQQMSVALQSILNGRSPSYQRVLAQCFPWPPEQAIERAVRRIRTVAAERTRSQPTARRFDMALYWGLLGNHSRAIRFLLRQLSNPSALQRPEATLLSLLQGRAPVEDVEYLVHQFAKPYQKPALLALWVRQIYRSEHRLPESVWLRVKRDVEFPPAVNTHNYLTDAATLGYVLLNAGEIAAAQKLADSLESCYPHVDDVRLLSARVRLRVRGLNSQALLCVALPLKLAGRWLYGRFRSLLAGYQ